MGDLIVLADRFADRTRLSASSEIAFFFDVTSPFSYLAAERIERLLGEVEWIPCAPLGAPGRAAVATAEREALAQRLPLVWPESWPAHWPGAIRAAAFAADAGRAAQFALAAGRLAFCGGFDLDDPGILCEAGAAAGLAPEDCLAAAGDSAWDAQPQATAEGLARRGIDQLPVIRVGRQWRSGSSAIAEAAGLLRAGTAALHSA